MTIQKPITLANSLPSCRTKLDDFLRLSERDILTHGGKTSHETALSKAHAEYEKYHALRADDPSPIHYVEVAVQPGNRPLFFIQ